MENLMQLGVVPATGLRSSYGSAPSRMLWLQPDAASSLRNVFAIYPCVEFTDLFRSPEVSLAAVLSGRGAQLPGYSGHNYGLCVDIDVDKAFKGGFTSKKALDDAFRKEGWVCHRLDGKRGPEDWHYNYLPGIEITGKFSSDELERKIVSMYSPYWYRVETAVAVEQECLRECKLYSGELDGKAGPITEQARKVFRRAWKIGDNEKQKYIRTLSLVAARK